VLTEVAVLISLFAAGVKMPGPMRLDRWRPPLRLLASASMALTVVNGVAFPPKSGVHGLTWWKGRSVLFWFLTFSQA